MKFLMIGGGVHTDKDGQRYEKGSMINSPTDLSKAFPGRFKKIDSVSPESVKRMAPAVLTVSRPDDPPIAPQKPREIKKVDFGTDVTRQFPDAIDADLLVFRKGALHTVVDKDEPSLALNEKGLKKKAVSEFISEYLED